jgi:hypothetical protein
LLLKGKRARGRAFFVSELPQAFHNKVPDQTEMSILVALRTNFFEM